jgi:putative flavoprotein involved in K+ transport
MEFARLPELAASEPDLADFGESEHIERWLAAFEAALASGDPVALRAVFADECHWRDLLAFTWSITPHDDVESAIAGLIEAQARVGASDFTLARNRTPPRTVKRHGRESIEGIFTFETATGRAEGLVRLLADQPTKAWVIATSLDELKGHEEPVGQRRPVDPASSRTFGGDNWSDLRRREQAFEDREPAVLIIGAGQAGLAIAARLRLLGVDTLVIDRNERVGDTWRNRYHSLALHNQVNLNHLPYLPWPPNWPKYLQKDMIGGWLETYAWAMECNVWNNTTFVDGRFDEESQTWEALVKRADGSERVLSPRHLIFANGVAGKPITPHVSGLDSFAGTVLHTSAFTSGADWAGKRALVLGAGTSGHDVAQDLQGHGCAVKLIQRGSTTVSSVKAAGLVHSVYYEENLPTQDADMIAAAGSYPLLVRGYQAAVKRMKEVDADLLAGLAARGFKLDFGEDETGHQMKFRRRHGGYYLDCGCAQLIIDGDVGLIQYEDIERFVPEGALMKDGSIEPADLVVTATGFQSQQQLVRDLLGDGIADKIGPIWGVADDGELRNMFRPTAQQGLWFIGGGFAHARIYSKYIALNIKAREIGLVA